MQKFKTLATSRSAVFTGGVLLALAAAWPLMGAAQDEPVRGKDSGPPARHDEEQPPAGRSLASQLAELRGKVARLEAALEKGRASGMSGMDDAVAGGMSPMGGEARADAGMEGMDEAGMKMGGTGPGKMPAGGMGMGGMGMGGMDMGGMDMGMNGMGMNGMGEAKGMDANGGDKAGTGGSARGTMDRQMTQLMQMMRQIAEMKMAEMKTTGMETGGDMPDTEGTETGEEAIGMPGRKGREMMGGGGTVGMRTPAALAAFPGTPGIYHGGSTGFFLDHPGLTAEQRTALDRLKDRSSLEQASFQKRIDGAERELGTLTGSDQPDAAKIDAKVREIEKLRGDRRLAFIRAVGDAGTLLTVEQRQSLAKPGGDTPSAHAGH